MQRKDDSNDSSFAYQRMAETCLDVLIDAITEMPDPDPNFWGDNLMMGMASVIPPQSGEITFHTIQYDLLEKCLQNTSAIRYVVSRRSQFFPQIMAALKVLPPASLSFSSVHSLMMLCILLDSPDNIAQELISEYKIMDMMFHHITRVRKYEDSSCDTLGFIANMCYYLAVMGGPEMEQMIKQHPVYYMLSTHMIIPLSTPGMIERIESTGIPKSVFYYNRLVKQMEGTGNGQSYKMLPAFERIRDFFDKPTYMVFCSLELCRKEANTDSVLRHCSACMLARYCNKECQTQHWRKIHKKECIGRKNNPK